MRRAFLVVFVVATVLLAGCSGTDAPAGGAAPATTASGPGDTGTDQTGDGAGADDGAAAVGDPAAILATAGSYTATWRYTLAEGAATTQTQEFVVAVDRVANRSFERSLTTDGTDTIAYERYSADGASYLKYGEGDEAYYRSGPQDTTVIADPMTDADPGDLSEFTHVGTEQFDGVTVDRYEYADPLLWRSYAAGTMGGTDNVTVTDFRLVVLVDRDGLARSTSWEVTGEGADGTPITSAWAYEITKVGATVVQEPAWLDAARA